MVLQARGCTAISKGEPTNTTRGAGGEKLFPALEGGKGERPSSGKGSPAAIHPKGVRSTLRRTKKTPSGLPY